MAIDWQPVWLTLQLATLTTLILLLVGTPLAWWLSQTRCFCRDWVGAIVALPAVAAAAVVAVDLARQLASSGRTVWDLLDDLAERHGAHVTANGSRRLDGPDARDRLDGLAAELVAHPPTTLGGNRVSDSDQPAGDVLRLWLTDGTRVVLRPSGTEPKFKYYCEAIEPVGTDRDSRAARRRARLRLRRIERDLVALFGSA